MNCHVVLCSALPKLGLSGKERDDSMIVGAASSVMLKHDLHDLHMQQLRSARRLGYVLPGL